MEMACQMIQNPLLRSTDADVHHDGLCMSEVVRSVSLGDNIAIMLGEHYPPNPLIQSGLDTGYLGYSTEPQGYCLPRDPLHHLLVRQPALDLAIEDTSFGVLVVDRSYQSSFTPASERGEDAGQKSGDAIAWSELPAGEWQPGNPFEPQLNHAKWDTEEGMMALGQENQVRLNRDGGTGIMLPAAMARPEYSEQESLYYIELQPTPDDDTAFDKLTSSSQYHPPQCSSLGMLGETTDPSATEFFPTLSHNPKTGSPHEMVLHSHREAQDHYLIQSKLSGMSYKEIKAKGQFKEAESTLRGRFRSLTKSKDQRVRRPQWQERDVSVLCCSRPAVRAWVTDRWFQGPTASTSCLGIDACVGN